MMRQSLEQACKGPVGKALLQGKKVGHGSSALQEGQCPGAVNVRHGSSTSGWDVGNPPTDEKNPGDAKGQEGEQKGSSNVRPDVADASSLVGEKTTRQYFHEKAKEVEDRLTKEKTEAIKK